jgi:predicted HTH domain antitoxin
LALDTKEAAILLAAQLYKQDQLSLGRAAELASYSKRTFMELQSNYGVAVLDLTEEQLLSDA